MAIDNSKENLVFLNWTKSGKGARMFLDGIDGIEDGNGLTCNKEHLEKFVRGEKDFVAFSRITPTEE